jgi:hypothetical protein
MPVHIWKPESAFVRMKSARNVDPTMYHFSGNLSTNKFDVVLRRQSVYNDQGGDNNEHFNRLVNIDVDEHGCNDVP